MGPIIPEKFDYIDHWKTINPIEHMVFKHISMCLKMTAKKCVFFHWETWSFTFFVDRSFESRPQSSAKSSPGWLIVLGESESTNQ
jgi:hypothetical protein